jgi:hypothetical protein
MMGLEEERMKTAMSS